MQIITVGAARKELQALQKKLAAYYHAASLISYDGATGAPKDTASNRAATLSVLSEEISNSVHRKKQWICWNSWIPSKINFQRKNAARQSFF